MMRPESMVPIIESSLKSLRNVIHDARIQVAAHHQVTIAEVMFKSLYRVQANTRGAKVASGSPEGMV